MSAAKRYIWRFILLVSIADIAMAFVDAVDLHPLPAVVAAVTGGTAFALAMSRLLGQAQDAPAKPAGIPARRFEPRDLRTGRDPALPSNGRLLTICPLCGMNDPFGLEWDDTRWRGWPAHWACVQTAQEPSPQPIAFGAPRWVPALDEVCPGGGMIVDVGQPQERPYLLACPALLCLHPADAHLPRIDVVFRVEGSGAVSYLTGWPDPHPVAPALASYCRPLARIRIDPGMTEIREHHITRIGDAGA